MPDLLTRFPRGEHGEALLRLALLGKAMGKCGPLEEDEGYFFDPALRLGALEHVENDAEGHLLLHLMLPSML